MISINQLIEELLARRPHHRAMLVGISGIDASGKTTYTLKLAKALVNQGVEAQVIHLDDFHFPAAARRRPALPPPLTYYNSTFDYLPLVENLLLPLRSGQDVQVQLPILDLETDQYKFKDYRISSSSMVLVEGVFLFRPLLRDFFDYRIFLDISFKTCLERVVVRDQYLFGSPEAVKSRYLEKYIPGQHHHLDKDLPREQAHLLLSGE